MSIEYRLELFYRYISNIERTKNKRRTLAKVTKSILYKIEKRFEIKVVLNQK